PSVQVPQLQAFANINPNDPSALFGAVLAALREVSGRLHGLSGGALDTKLPLVGRSTGDLLGSTETGGGDAVTYGANTLTDRHRTFPRTASLGRRVVVGSQVALVTDVVDGHLVFADNFAPPPAAGTPYVLGDELGMAIDRLTASPASSLQDLVKRLNDAL